MSAAIKGSVAAGCAARCNGAPLMRRKAFSGQAVTMALPKRSLGQRGVLLVRAFDDYDEEPREWPYPKFIQEVKDSFPDKAVATVEEARVLFSEDGYTYLDVRPALEYEEAGRVKGSVNIPIVNAKRVWDPEQKKKVIKKEDNDKFTEQVKKRFPDTEAKLLIGCSDGRKYSIDALTALDEEGYTNIVGLRGGFYAWFKVFDNKLGRRRLGEYAENYMGDGSDSTGIHASGAGFERVDAIERWAPPEFE